MHRVSALLSFAIALPAQIIPVAGGGAALQNAIQTAPNNAILVVASGAYSAVTATPTGNVTVVAPQGATVTGSLSVTFAGQGRLTVVGVTVLPVVQFPSITGGVLSTNGDLRAEQCSASGLVVTGGGTPRLVHVQGGTFGGVVVNQLQNVHAVLIDATFHGFSQSGQVGQPGLVITGPGSLRAERITATGGSGAFQGGAGLTVDADAVLVDSSFVGASGGPGQNWAVLCGGQLTLSNCALNGPVLPTPIQRTVPSAAWISEAWTPGGTSTVRLREAPQSLAATVASLDLVAWTSPVAAELLYVGATPNWLVVSLGVTGPGGDLAVPFTLPNTPAALYASVWLTGAFVSPLPLRTTCPLGGLVH